MQILVKRVSMLAYFKMGLAPSFPIEVRPVSFERTDNYTSTGTPVRTVTNNAMEVRPQTTSFNQIHEAIYQDMVEVRRTCHKPRAKLENVDFQDIIEDYPRFNLANIAEFRIEFIHFDKDEDALLSFEDICKVLDKLGDDSSEDLRFQSYVEAMTQDLGKCDFYNFVALCDALSRKRDEVADLDGDNVDLDSVKRTPEPVRADAEIVQRPSSLVEPSPILGQAGRYRCPVVEFIETEMDSPSHDLCKGKCKAKSAHSPSYKGNHIKSAQSLSFKGNHVKNNLIANKYSCANPGPSMNHLHEQTLGDVHLQPSSASLSENNRVT